MLIPVIRGVIDRRILINYRVDPEVLAKLLPPPFRPKIVGGAGVAGVCLIRLRHIRPRWLPAIAGISSENAAHRIAVKWGQGTEIREGVYIPRRDTSAWINTLAGGRLFPGTHHHARCRAEERDGAYNVRWDSDDGQTHVAIEAHEVGELRGSSTFSSLQAASDFFQRGSLGYSSRPGSGECDGLDKLRTTRKPRAPSLYLGSLWARVAE
jgi:hypothetical protein